MTDHKIQTCPRCGGPHTSAGHERIRVRYILENEAILRDETRSDADKERARMYLKALGGTP